MSPSEGFDAAHQTRRDRIAAATSVVAIAVAALLLVTQGLLLVAYLLNGDEGISDNWVGYVAGISLLVGLAVSAIDFVVALVVRRRLGQSRRARLALYEFPVLVVLIVMFEIFLGE